MQRLAAIPTIAATVLALLAPPVAPVVAAPPIAAAAAAATKMAVAPGDRDRASNVAGRRAQRPGAEEVAERLRKLRAAALLHVVRFARWPDDRFETDDAPVVVGVPRGAAITPYLVATFRDHGAGGRRILVRELDLVPESDAGGRAPDAASESARIAAAVAACHVLYVPEDRRTARVLARAWPVARREHVLMVTEARSALDRGGMLAMPLVDGRISLVVNRTTQREAGIELSSRLLKLATIVEREVRP